MLWVWFYLARRCEAGDLSNKWGYVEPNVNIDVVDNTSTLFLRGRYSIVGRSIVIHSHIAPYPNFACATIRSNAEIEGKLIFSCVWYFS